MSICNSFFRPHRQAGRRVLLTGACLAAFAPAAWAQAQTVNSGDALDEVVVTAQRRSEKLQDVPIAITALSPTKLEDSGIAGTSDLSAIVPGLNFIQGSAVYGLPVIRGVGTTSQGPSIENPVATYIDGIYIASTVGSLMSLNDIDQVAVLKGPQGTLFGRNATGGLIQVTTQTPSHEFSGNAQATFGNVGTFGQSVYLTGGLSDTVAMNIAALNDDQFEGFGKNLVTDQWVQTHHSRAIRSKILWTPSSDWTVTLSGDYAKFVTTGPDTHTESKDILGSYWPGGFWDLNLHTTPQSHVEQAGTSVKITHDFQGVQLNSITAYRNDQLQIFFDADALPTTNVPPGSPALNVTINQKDSQFSQELQLVSTGSGSFSWQTGLFFMSADSQYDPGENQLWFSRFIPNPSRFPTFYTDEKLDSYAAYAQGSYKIDEATNLTAGVRYSIDRRFFDARQYTLINGVEYASVPFVGAPIPGVATGSASKNFDRPTWRLSLDHRFSDEVMGYLSYNRGFRSGTFVPQALPPTVLKPEVLDAIEIGAKTDLLDRRLELNTAAFYYDYRNRQVLGIVNGFQTLYDAQHATSYGLDADLTWRATHALTVTGGVSAIRAKYDKFTGAPVFTANPAGGYAYSLGDVSGKTLESTPTWTTNIGAAYHHSTAIGDFRYSANFYHNAGWWAGPDNYEKQSPYSTLSAEVTWLPDTSNGLSLKLWGKNLTNTHYASQMTETAYSLNEVPAPGRTFGVTCGITF